jgi:7-cyano-7-deazaguanine synthase
MGSFLSQQVLGIGPRPTRAASFKEAALFFGSFLSNDAVRDSAWPMIDIQPAAPGAAAIILLSGGLDSMVVAGIAARAGYRIFALTIDYNQRHRIELEAAARIAAVIGVERHVVMPIDLTRFGGSALTDTDIAVPKDGVEPGIPVTYVPARNTIFLSLALGWAEAVGARDLFVGINALDYSGYPDCRPEFVSAFEAMAMAATKAGDEGARFKVHAPLIDMTKADIARAAYDLGLDAGLSWSCYDPGDAGLPCGLCDSCRLRAKGFADAGLIDPTRNAAVRP